MSCRTRWTAVLLAPVVVAACTGGSSHNTQRSDGTHVTIELLAFKPSVLSVSPRTSVTWMQQDPGFHTVTSGIVRQEAGGVTKQPDGRFDSGKIATGATYSFTFADPGNYRYFCSLHPATMQAQVQVT